MSYQSVIVAPMHVSESEVKLLNPNYDTSWYKNKRSLLEKALWNLGLDTNRWYELQPIVQHRNRLNAIVTCSRYSGSERTDIAWLDSGLASQAAKDKAKNSPFVDSLYHARSETVIGQLVGERKNPCSTDEQVQEFMLEYEPKKDIKVSDSEFKELKEAKDKRKKK